MKFKDLAWGAFGFRSISDDNAYRKLVRDKDFLARLQTEPFLDDFQKLRDFLVNYGVHYARINLAEQYSSIWPQLKPHVTRLAGEILETSDLNCSEIEEECATAFNCLQSAWGGDTVVSKVLHFFNISLFVMWDIPIQVYYRKYDSYGYIEFLRIMQRNAIELTEDFQRLSLSGTPAELLSQQLGYDYVRPITKFLDDYNWATITRAWPQSIPKWLLALDAKE